jgi:hypothetical protein
MSVSATSHWARLTPASKSSNAARAATASSGDGGAIGSLVPVSVGSWSPGTRRRSGDPLDPLATDPFAGAAGSAGEAGCGVG